MIVTIIFYDWNIFITFFTQKIANRKKLPTELWQRMLFDITKINKDLKQEHYEQNRKTRRLSSNHR